MPINISRITINASQQKVWDILTKPEFVKKWQFGSELETSWQPGDPITFTTDWQGRTFKQWGKVLEFKPCDRLIYNLFSPSEGVEDIPENYFLMTYLLYSEDGKTKLEIIQEDNRPNARQEPVQGEDNPVLKALKDLAEVG